MDLLPRSGVEGSPLQGLGLASDYDGIYHLAAAKPSEDLKSQLQSNVELGAHLAEWASEHKIPLIAAASYWQYAQGTQWSFPQAQPNSLYAATKAAFTLLLDYYARDKGLQALSLVLFDVYGEDDSRPKLLSALPKLLRAGEPLNLTKGEQEILAVHVEDVVEGFVQAPRHLEPGQHRVFALGDWDQRRTLRQLVEQAQQLQQQQAAAPLCELKWGARPYPQGQVMKLPQVPPLPGWQQEISWDQGLGRMFNYEG